MTSMVEFQNQRRVELANGAPRATAIPTGGVGSHGNTSHINWHKPIVLAPYPSIRIPPRQK